MSSSSFTVTTGTATSISCTPSSIDYNGGQTTCTVTVTSDDSGDSQSITGSVNLSGLPGDASSGSCTLTGPAGVSSCSVTYTAKSSVEGTYSISATYDGDVYHGGSSTTSSSSFTVTTATSASIVCSPSSISYNGGQTTCTVTVTSGDGGDKQAITGIVTLSGLPGDASSTSCTLTGPAAVASCSVTYTAHSGDEGTYSISASYAGDGYHGSSSTSSPASFTVYTPTATSLECTSASISFTGSTSCTVIVTNVDTGDHTPPAGTITISGGPSDFQTTCSLASSGSASSCTFTYDAASGDEGVYSISATFASSGGAHLGSGPSSPPFGLTINTPTSIILSCTSDDISYTGSTSCTVTVTNGDTTYKTAPTGTISFSGGPSDFTGSLCTLSGSGDSSELQLYLHRQVGR